MASINLGGFTSIGGKNVTSGLASGLDTESLVNAIIDAKKIPVTRLEDKQTLSSDKTTAYGELRSLLSKLRTATDALRNPPSLLTSTGNFFAYRKAFITSNTSVPGNTYAGVAADPSSQTGSFTLENIVLAKAKAVRSIAFTSKTANVTDATGTNNAQKFSAGSFQITSGDTAATVTRATGDMLSAADITTSGTVGTSALNAGFGAGGLAMAAGGDFDLVGSLSTALTATSASQANGTGGDVTLSVTINGRSYTSAPIAANTGVGTNEIAANTTIVLSNATTGASFQIQTGAALTINAQSDLDNFATAIGNDLKPLTFFQSRELGNFNVSKTADTSLSGLASSHIHLTSDSFNLTDDTHGKMGAFSVSAVSAPGAGDGQIQVSINGETYRATGLGNGANLVTGNITLTSLTSSKTLSLDFGDAGLSLDLSSTASALALQRDLNQVFGTGVDVAINEGDSLTNIAAAINAQNHATGVSATIIQVAANDFRLTLQSDKTGLENAFNLLDTQDVFSSTVALNPAQSAQDSSFTLNSTLTITRPTNNISDVVAGVTFSLFENTPVSTKVTVEIGNDTATAKDAIINFMNNYNDFRAFVGKQRERDDQGALVKTAVIGSDPTLDSAISRTERELNAIITSLTSGSPTRLSDLGITFTDFAGDDTSPPATNILQLDESKLDAALQNNFDAVRRIFEFSSTISSSVLRPYTRSNALGVKDFQVDINITRPVGDQVRVTYTDATTGLPVTINADFAAGTGTNGTISGKNGTVLEGLKLIYVGDGTDVVDVNLSQGIADRLYNALDDFTKDGGLIDTQTKSLQSQHGRLQTDIDRLNERIDDLRERLLAQFSRLEEVISKSNALLQFLEAQLNVFTAQK